MDMTPENLKRLMSDRTACTIVKDDASASVGIADGSVFGLSFAICIKRFHGRGLFYSVLRNMLGSRARRLMDISRQLAAKGLQVAKPVAYFDHSFAIGDAFFISEAIENAENLGTIASRGSFKPEMSFETGLAKTISEWHRAGAVHGDLKWSNILYQRVRDGFIFHIIDLDQTRIYPTICRRGIIQDLRRFYRYGLELGQEAWVEHRFFPLYLSGICADADIASDIPELIRKARQEWAGKGSRKIVKIDSDGQHNKI